jgi:uncharacterized membrane protein YccC
MVRTEIGVAIIFFVTLGTDFNAGYIFTLPVYFISALETYYGPRVIIMKYN